MQRRLIGVTCVPYVAPVTKRHAQISDPLGRALYLYMPL